MMYQRNILFLILQLYMNEFFYLFLFLETKSHVFYILQNFQICCEDLKLL